MDNKITTVGIHQPNFMPWLGYFYKIFQSDIFIFLDDVQLQKTGASYTNKVSINIKNESSALSIPIKRDSGIWTIKETVFANNKWKKKIIGSLQANYAKAPYFKEHKEFIFELINFESDSLSEYNIHFITEIAKKLNLQTKFVKSSDIPTTLTSTSRLIYLIQQVQGNIYISGSGGDNYQDKELYEKNNIGLIYNKMPQFKYNQYKTDKFISGLSIIDAIFNIGIERLQKDLFIKKS